jgi:2-polyprenyl-6-methoxyphenol hydroxylase-like FAD-dependent oxidoreductase
MIAGLGAARALRQRGLATDVVEREPAWTHTGAGIYLPGNAARALRALGLESAVAERGSPITQQRFCDHRGRLLADIDLAALWGDVGPCFALHRADLHEVLASHGDPVPARMGLAMRRFSQQASRILVPRNTRRTGSAGQQTDTVTVESATPPSTATTWSSGPTASTPRSASSSSALARFDRWGGSPGASSPHAPSEVTTWTVLLGRDVTFLAVPIGRGQVYCYCDAPTEGTPRLRGDDVIGKLAELLIGFAAPVPAILDTLGPDGAVHVAPIEEVTLDSWSQGSVLLVGDAAHATSPNMAEGAAMALEDGLILAECLAASGRDVAQAVARFEARRRPRTQWVLTQTHRRDRTRNLPPALRNLVLRRWGRNIVHANYRRLLDIP